MTYITGWKNKTSVFIAADSAITYDNKASVENAKVWSDVSTFGEKHILASERVTQEQWLKIYNLEDRLILAFAGNVRTAHETIDILKFALNNSEWRDIKGCFEHVCKEYGGGEVRIIAGFIENEMPILVSYDCNSVKGYKEHDFFEPVHAGSISSEFVEYSNQLFFELRHRTINDEQNLVSICAVFQSFKYVADLIGQGVGGHFSGIRIDKFGIHWQKDISYFPFQHNGQNLQSFHLSDVFGEAQAVTVVVRDNLEFIGNTFTHFRFSRRPFGNYQPKAVLESQEWQDKRFNWACKWSEEVNHIIDILDADYFIFISTKLPIIISVFSKEFIEAFSLFELKVEGEEKAFFFNSETLFDFVKSLTTPVDDEFTVQLFVDPKMQSLSKK
ncbi:hypothetical protein [Nafulsella turpanensis]|uniref:hypothetical protein n=1 Tax=Nafulsella turpanensis TaxID=1265690 RepID=UPI00034B67B8|nr:hypothetical protein [Nafulsella turpanensis]